MKVLHVISSVDPRGGGPIEGVFSSAAVWARHGHQRHILCLDAPDAPWVENSPVRVFAVGIAGGWYKRLQGIVPWLRYGYTPNLVRWLKQCAHEYDAIVVNGLWNYASFGSWRALHQTHTPYVVFTHGMLDPWFNKINPKKTFFKRIFWQLFEHRVLRDASGVMFTCDEERQLAAQSFSPYYAREFVVGYGTRDVQGDPALQRAAFAERVPQLAGRKFILFLSRIHPKKGVDLLIQAFARHAALFPDLDLVIAGPDQTGWASALKAQAAELGIAHRIHWPGMLTGDPKWGAFRSAEFFALPSHQENFGIVVAEAMALSKPVLITNQVNIWHEIEAAGAGIVVNDDMEGIAAGLRSLCALAPEEREAIGRRGRDCFLQHYDLESNAMHLLELLRRITSRHENAAADRRAIA